MMQELMIPESTIEQILTAVNDLSLKVDANHAQQQATNSELYEAMQIGFARVDERFEIVDQRFDIIDQRFDAVDMRFLSIEGELSKIRINIADLQENMDMFTTAYEKDAVTIVYHDERITKLEKLAKVA